MSEEDKLSLSETREIIRKDSRRSLQTNIGTSLAVLTLFLTMFLSVYSGQQKIIAEQAQSKLELMEFIKDNFVTTGVYQSMVKKEQGYYKQAILKPTKIDSIFREQMDALAWEFNNMSYRGDGKDHSPFNE